MLLGHHMYQQPMPCQKALIDIPQIIFVLKTVARYLC